MGCPTCPASHPIFTRYPSTQRMKKFFQEWYPQISRAGSGVVLYMEIPLGWLTILYLIRSSPLLSFLLSVDGRFPIQLRQFNQR